MDVKEKIRVVRKKGEIRLGRWRKGYGIGERRVVDAGR